MTPKQILDSLNIEYKTEGKNVSQGWAGISCPYCDREGNPDPDFHLGVNLNTGFFSCWRNTNHKGSLPKLVSVLVGISYKEAVKMVDRDEPLASNFRSTILSKFSKGEEKEKIDLQMPKEFYKFIGSRQDKRASNYLIRRGFPRNKHLNLSELYGIRYCYTGSFRDRIIFPVYEKGTLMTWVGRSFYNIDERYKNLPKKESVQSVKDCLLFYDYLMEQVRENKNSIVYLCEGPFDALKMNMLLPEGYYATCLFGVSLSDRQLTLLSRFPKDVRFEILLDAEYEHNAMHIRQKAFPVQLGVKTLPKGTLDPGDMNKTQLEKFLGLETRDAA